MKTVGGKPDYIPIEGPEKELLEVLSMQINGLPTLWDSVNMLTETTITGEASKKDDIIGDFPNPVTETIAYCAEPFSAEKTDIYQRYFWKTPIRIFFSPKPTEAEEKIIVIQTKDALEENPEKKPTSASQTWKSWSPGLLKSRLKAGRENKTKKMDYLLELREELISKQIWQIENEERRAQEKHEEEIELLNVNILIKQKELADKDVISFV